MKAFFEEYGLSMLAAIAILVLIVIISPLGSVISTSLGGSTNSLKAVGDDAKTKAESALADINGLDVEEKLVWNDIDNPEGLILETTNKEPTGQWAVKGKNLDVTSVTYSAYSNNAGVGRVSFFYETSKDVKSVTANNIEIQDQEGYATYFSPNNNHEGSISLKIGYIYPAGVISYIAYDYIELEYENTVCFNYEDGTKEYIYLRIDHLK